MYCWLSHCESVTNGDPDKQYSVRSSPFCHKVAIGDWNMSPAREPHTLLDQLTSKGVGLTAQCRALIEVFRRLGVTWTLVRLSS
jgi:hypothetical protein